MRAVTLSKDQLRRLGFDDESLSLAETVLAQLPPSWSKATLKTQLKAVLRNPAAYQSDPSFGELAATLLEDSKLISFHCRDCVDWPNYSDGERPLLGAQRLPISVYGAILPGRQPGLGLPVGGVLATKGAVIPRALGRDIGCSVVLSVFNRRAGKFSQEMADVLLENTRFGARAGFAEFVNDPVFDDPVWSRNSTLKRAREAARMYFGSRGTGNHFADLGVFHVERDLLNLRSNFPYVALLTHFGTRGAGQQIATVYQQKAREYQELPKELKDWAYLPLDTQEGQDFWDAQDLCRRTALAGHRWLHGNIGRALDCELLYQVASCHNFAVQDGFRGEDVVVHRKGTIQLREGELGIICGSMLSPSKLVVGTENEVSLWSAAHGAGRTMGRHQARRQYRGRAVKNELKEAGVRLLSGGQDEWPGVYREVGDVVRSHGSLIQVVGSFQPRLVAMNPHNDPAED